MRKFIIKVNGNSYEVEVEELGVDKGAEKPIASSQPQVSAPVQQPVKETAPKEEPKIEKQEVAVSEGQEVIEAPMPGNILKVMVKPGDKVKAGELLLILEAMKMENEIVAPNDGTVASINVSKGASVNVGEVLVSLK